MLQINNAGSVSKFKDEMFRGAAEPQFHPQRTSMPPDYLIVLYLWFCSLNCLMPRFATLATPGNSSPLNVTFFTRQVKITWHVKILCSTIQAYPCFPCFLPNGRTTGVAMSVEWPLLSCTGAILNG